ncbi:hypothetical protein V8G54_012355, partial [Vigna mungo]
TLYQSDKGYDFKSVVEMLALKKTSETLNVSKVVWKRYGENAEEVAQLANWTCPKCRGICNCSLCQSYVCRNRRGEQPTDLLYRSAKESGFKSVAEMLAMKRNLETSSNPLNESNMRKEPEVFLSGELGNEHFSDANVTEVCTNYDSGENFVMNLERNTYRGNSFGTWHGVKRNI